MNLIEMAALIHQLRDDPAPALRFWTNPKPASAERLAAVCATRAEALAWVEAAFDLKEAMDGTNGEQG